VIQSYDEAIERLSQEIDSKMKAFEPVSELLCSIPGLKKSPLKA
jgi:hypothetical protein